MACNMPSPKREILSTDLLTNTNRTKQMIQAHAQLLQIDASDRNQTNTLPNMF
jgi:hypothetical protein